MGKDVRNKRVGEVVKKYREPNYTQQTLSLEIPMSRTGFAEYEQGSVKMPNDVGQKVVTVIRDPFMVMEMSQAFTGVGPVVLDGPHVDLHRSSVKEKTIEEMEEALDKLKSFCFSKPFNYISHYEVGSFKDTIKEMIEAITALNHMVAVMCKESESADYVEMWKAHYRYLYSHGYISKGQFEKFGAEEMHS
ncbi:XRE family transcriptional regulator [Jeotgalibacillus proteolyticus]|uniref:XRE family transcriptional regulator n=1 Tax=Jeotgalibacillus proteolyticus TaxID=2082395 RepID=A0A2S5GAX7_9BACL|nr:XRE family transcriptional regulator [Jeotgalibacillus proteolyticus]PPA70075.1 XRE family transcriptional regulator [Jeotgalibacillus proteolyticus]